MPPEIPGYLAPFGIVVRTALCVLVLGGLWLALQRTRLILVTKRRTWITTAVVLLSWFAVAWWLARQGAFEASPDTIVPVIPFAIVPPIVIGLLVATRSLAIGAAIDAVPHAWLIGVQAYRALGAIFLVLWADGLLPGAFALPAGIGDVLVGVSALAVALMWAAGASGARPAAYLWNALGIADLLIAVATGFLTSPGPLQLLALDSPNLLISAYPLVMIPVFAVPLSVILHGLSLWKLAREARSSAAARQGACERPDDIGRGTSAAAE